MSDPYNDFDLVPTSVHIAAALAGDAFAESYIQSQILEYAFNQAAKRWYNTRNGRFASETVVRQQLYKHQEATYGMLDNITRQLYAGNISIQQWQLGVAQQLKDAHLAQAMYAVGGRRNMTQANYGRVGGTLRSEFRYLNNFANDIEQGKVSEAQALARIKQYGNATQQSYWREYREDTEGKIKWVLGIAEHCPDCIELDAGSPYTTSTLPTVPGAGATQCRGNCRCHLERI